MLPDIPAEARQALKQERSFDDSLGEMTDVSFSESSLTSEDLNSVGAKSKGDDDKTTKNQNESSSSSTRSKRSIHIREEDPVDAGAEHSQKVYTIGEHCKLLMMDEDTRGAGYSVDMTIHYTHDTEYLPFSVREFCQPIPNDILSKMYAGVQAGETTPVRTLSIQLRPDVRSDQIMERLWNVVVAQHNGSIMSQYGGFIRAIIGGKFTIEAQICTLTSECLDRTLLVRIFKTDSDEAQVVASPVSGSSSKKIHPSLDHLRVSTALVKLIDEKLEQVGSLESTILDSPFSEKEDIHDSEQASVFLNARCSAPAGMRDLKSWFSGNQHHYPTLSSAEWTVAVASGMICQDVWDALSQDCVFQSIKTLPATNHTTTGGILLDMQYCSQLEYIAKLTVESSMRNKVQKFNDLKHKVEEVVESITIFKQVTEQTCKEYGIIDVESTETLDQERSQEESVYLEDLVTQTMAKLDAEHSAEYLSSIEGVDVAVVTLYQDIFEQRKKELLQKVQDVSRDLETRLVEQEFHLREAYRILRDCSKTSAVASAKGKHFLNMVLNARNVEDGRPKTLLRTVPFVSFETTDGMCHVSATHIVIDCKGGRVFSNPHKLLFALGDIDIQEVNVASQQSCSSMELAQGGKRKLLLKTTASNSFGTSIPKFLRILKSLLPEE